MRRLLLALPELKSDEGIVSERLRAMGASDSALNLWRDVVREPNLADDEDGAW